MALEHSSAKEMNPTLKNLKEAVITTAYGGVQGAVYGGIIGMVFLAPLAYPRDLESVSRTQLARMFARYGSACFAASSGTDSIMRGIRGKKDLTSELVSASGTGLVLSFVSEGLKVKPANALSMAAVFAVVSGTIYKVGEKISSRFLEDSYYTEARAMLSMLGLEEYKKNFMKGHLTDYTLPLLTDSDLKEVNIPPGARLLILDHIKRYNTMVNPK